MQEVSTVSKMTLITRNRAMENVVVTTTATTAEVNKLCGRKTGRSVPEQGGCAFPARTASDHTSNSFDKERDMINNLITHLKEETSEDAEHKGWCNTELTTNTQTRKEKTATVEKFHDNVDELDASMDNLTMEVAKLFAQVSHQVEIHEGKKIQTQGCWNEAPTRGYACSSLHQRDFGIECSDDPFVKVKKLIQDLFWKLQLKFLRKTGRQLNKLSRDKSTTGNTQGEFHLQ